MEFQRFDEATFSYLGATYTITIWIDPYAEMYLADWLQTDPPGQQPAIRTKTPRPFPPEVISEAILQAARHAERLATTEAVDPTAGMDVVSQRVTGSVSTIKNDFAAISPAPTETRVCPRCKSAVRRDERRCPSCSHVFR